MKKYMMIGTLIILIVIVSMVYFISTSFSYNDSFRNTEWYNIEEKTILLLNKDNTYLYRYINTLNPVNDFGLSGKYVKIKNTLYFKNNNKIQILNYSNDTLKVSINGKKQEFINQKNSKFISLIFQN